MNKIVAPMGGKVIDVKIKNGDHINENDEIIILEAMKMELPIIATSSGEIKEVNCNKGDLIKTGDILVVFD